MSFRIAAVGNADAAQHVWNNGIFLVLERFVMEDIYSDEMLRPCETKWSKARESGVGSLWPPLSDNHKRKMIQKTNDTFAVAASKISVKTPKEAKERAAIASSAARVCSVHNKTVRG